MNISEMMKSNFLDFETINKYVIQDPQGFVDEVEHTYRKNIAETAKIITKFRSDCKIIMLCGPSSSGKTTTANMLKDELDKTGSGAIKISLDDFYNDSDKAPRLPNGEKDFESVNALRIDEIEKCLTDLLTKGECEKPVFSFTGRRISDVKVHTELKEGQIVIVEGIHALNPLLTNKFPPGKMVKIYLRVNKEVVSGSRVILSESNIRLLRRLVRDYRFRASDANETISMWQNVCDGEMKYIRPYKNSASFLLDSFHAYEPCLWRRKVMKILCDGTIKNEFLPKVSALKEYLPVFEPLDKEYIPKNSLMREFIGGGIYT